MVPPQLALLSTRRSWSVRPGRTFDAADHGPRRERDHVARGERDLHVAVGLDLHHEHAAADRAVGQRDDDHRQPRRERRCGDDARGRRRVPPRAERGRCVAPRCRGVLASVSSICVYSCFRNISLATSKLHLGLAAAQGGVFGRRLRRLAGAVARERAGPYTRRAVPAARSLDPAFVSTDDIMAAAGIARRTVSVWVEMGFLPPPLKVSLGHPRRLQPLPGLRRRAGALHRGEAGRWLHLRRGPGDARGDGRAGGRARPRQPSPPAGVPAGRKGGRRR
jgi:hypothetical protein